MLFLLSKPTKAAWYGINSHSELNGIRRKAAEWHRAHGAYTVGLIPCSPYGLIPFREGSRMPCTPKA